MNEQYILKFRKNIWTIQPNQTTSIEYFLSFFELTYENKTGQTENKGKVQLTEVIKVLKSQRFSISAADGWCSRSSGSAGKRLLSTNQKFGKLLMENKERKWSVFLDFKKKIKKTILEETGWT